MKRIALLTTLVLAFALAVPASAATWRTVGQIKGQAQAATKMYAPPSFYTGMRNVEDVQVGLRRVSQPQVPESALVLLGDDVRASPSLS